MLFAAWWQPGRALPEPLWSAVSGVLQSPGAARFAVANAALAVWLPYSLETDGPAATVWPGPRSESMPLPGHPGVCLVRDTLTIAAGPLPQYPLYYARGIGEQYLLACSRLEPLASLFPQAALNGERMVSLMEGGVDLDTDATVYAGLKRLRPCETIVAGRGEVRVTRAFPHLRDTYRRGKVEDLAAELRHHLDAAVGRAIGCSNRVAVFVSGGLDSSGVLALAAARCRAACGREVEALSVQHPGPGDDRPYFTELTTSLGLPPVRLSPRDAGPWFARSLLVDAQPVASPSLCLGVLLGTTAVERGADVVLTGTSGDRICGGPFPFSNLARRGHLVDAASAALRVRIPWQMSPARRLWSLVFSPLVPPALRRMRHRFARKPHWMTRQARDLLGRCRTAAERHIGALPDTPDAWMERLCTWDYLLDNADLHSQLATVVGCAPVDVFLDFEFVRFMLELDPLVLSHGHQDRGLYRLAMKGVLPERVRTREDKGDFEPAVGAAAVAANAFETLGDLSSLRALATLGLVDPAPFRPAFNACLTALRRGAIEHDNGADEQIVPAWQLLSVEAFVREYGKGRSLS